MSSQEIIKIDDFTLIVFKMTVQNHLMPNGSQQRLDSISFWIKRKAKFIFNQGNYALK
jgi:hypothetical protein